jgi:L-Ala-D/L-Glu epimerase
LLHPEILWETLAPILRDDYFALCAVDMAYWDFYARKNNKTLRGFWAKEKGVTPLTSYTIGIDSIEKMQQKIMEKPWPIYKIKLGTSNDIQIIESLRKVTDSVFRIDANCAWNADQTIEYSRILKDLNVEFIEQPLKADDIKGMKRVKSESLLPIIADESCQREEDVLSCSKLFHGINIKLMKCGGITPALRMIKLARENNLLLMAGCMTESTIGISGLTQIASLLDYLDADGALLISQDIASGVTFNFGNIVYSNSFGTGAKLYT